MMRPEAADRVVRVVERLNQEVTRLTRQGVIIVVLYAVFMTPYLYAQQTYLLAIAWIIAAPRHSAMHLDLSGARAANAPSSKHDDEVTLAAAAAAALSPLKSSSNVAGASVAMTAMNPAVIAPASPSASRKDAGTGTGAAASVTSFPGSVLGTDAPTSVGGSRSEV